MNQKAIFFDIDGTLITEGEHIAESTINALHQLQESGHKTFICTGRSRSMIPNDLIDTLGVNGIVAAGGMYVEYNGEIIHNIEMPQEQIKRVLTILKEHNTVHIFEGSTYLYYNAVEMEELEKPFLVKMVEAQMKEYLYKLTDVAGDIHANKFSCILNDPDVDVLYDKLSEEFTIQKHFFNMAEFIPKGNSKATGIEKMCAYLRILQEDTVCFGDSINDVEMLQYCHVGVAMGNASDVAKEHADYVTTSIHKDGIYNGCIHLGLL